MPTDARARACAGGVAHAHGSLIRARAGCRRGGGGGAGRAGGGRREAERARPPRAMGRSRSDTRRPVFRPRTGAARGGKGRGASGLYPDVPCEGVGVGGEGRERVAATENRSVGWWETKKKKTGGYTRAFVFFPPPAPPSSHHPHPTPRTPATPGTQAVYPRAWSRRPPTHACGDPGAGQDRAGPPHPRASQFFSNPGRVRDIQAPLPRRARRVDGAPHQPASL